MNKFFNNPRFFTVCILTILLLGSFLRFYRIREYMAFLGDEGRDVLVVKRMIVDHKFTLLGPITSVGSMYMGPAYYYLMLPFLWLSGLDPVGPSIMVAIFAVCTVYLVYRIGRDFFHPWVGITASFLYAISPLTIQYGRSSWNPNVVPFFSGLLIYGLLQTIIHKKYNWLFVAGICLGIVIQLHYVTLLFIPMIVISLFVARTRVPLKYIVGLIGFSLIGYSPFLIFELRHGFVNTLAVIRFVGEGHSGGAFPILNIAQIVNDVLVRIFWRLLVIENAELTKGIILVIAAVLSVRYMKLKTTTDERKSFVLVLIWLITGLLSFGFYRGVIYDYYFGSLFIIPFLLFSLSIVTLFQKSYFWKITSFLIFIAVVFFSVIHSPLLMEPNNLVRNTENVARFVYDKVDGKPYNFALIATHNSDHAYKYFLEVWGRPSVTIEPPAVDPNRTSVTEQLIVVCEEKVCSPLGHPLWEIAGFGSAQIKDEWSIGTVKIFRLIPLTEKDGTTS